LNIPNAAKPLPGGSESSLKERENSTNFLTFRCDFIVLVLWLFFLGGQQAQVAEITVIHTG
jgi:hypothetical protein